MPILTHAQRMLQKDDCAAIVNNYTQWVAEAGTCSTSTTDTTSQLIGNDNPEKAFNFFRNNGLSPAQAAAVVGNIMQEAYPEIGTNYAQGTRTPHLNPSDLTTQLQGWGMIGWTPGNKVLRIADQLGIKYNFNDANDPASISNFALQLNIVWQEMLGKTSEYPASMLAGLKAINDVPTATEYFRANYERGLEGKRQQYAQEVYQKYGGDSNSTDSTSVVNGTNAPTCSSSSISCTPSAPTTAGTSSNLRQKVVCLAQSELQLWTSGQMKPGQDFLKYVQSKSVELWCADFTSWLYNQAGYPIGSGANWDVPGVAGVRNIGQQATRFTWHAAGGSYTPQPGDMVTYDSSAHINIVVSVNTSTGKMTVIGGDQGGSTSPYGSHTAAGDRQYALTAKVSTYEIPFAGGGASGMSVDGFVSPKDTP